jgi:hypothetical protein
MMMMMRMVELSVVWISVVMEEEEKVLLKMVEVRVVLVVFVKPAWRTYRLLPIFLLLWLVVSWQSSLVFLIALPTFSPLLLPYP